MLDSLIDYLTPFYEKLSVFVGENEVYVIIGFIVSLVLSGAFFGFFILVALVILRVIFGVFFWQVLVLYFVLCILDDLSGRYFTVTKKRKEEKLTRLAEEEREEKERQRLAKEEKAEKERKELNYQKDQEAYLKELKDISENSLEVYERIPIWLYEADQWLNVAENEFCQNAFSLFWDAIEKTISCLDGFSRNVKNISEQVQRREKLSGLYDGELPEYFLDSESVNALDASESIRWRMSQIVQSAHRSENQACSIIYEQRRQSQILIAGFNSLTTAIDNIGYRISNSIDELRNEISELSSNLGESLSKIDNSIKDVVDKAQGTSDSVNSLCSKLDELGENQHSLHIEEI